ncbi:MAG: PH domain-containing protein [Austwickia sp.]|nr:PH domain-containing protein [Austwickia sp.]
MSAPSGGPPLQVPWRRLSARMLLIHPVNEVLTFLPAVIGVFLLGRAQDDGMPWQLQAAMVVVPVVVGFGRYFTTTYRIGPDQLQLRRGLLQRATLTAPIDRVRTVDVTAPVLHRLLGLAKVTIGTGAGTPVTLDGLGAAAAADLRAELLHRSADTAQLSGTEHPGLAGPAGATLLAGATLPAGATAPAVPAPAGYPTYPRDATETELSRFQRSWVRYAPFTFSGWLVALAVWGFLAQFGNDLIVRVIESEVGRAVETHLAQAAWWTIAIEALLILGTLITVLSLTAYVLSYWNFSLTRHHAGTLHVARGLLTTRAVSIEEARVRGVSLAEPAMLRLVGAARLTALLTGTGPLGVEAVPGRSVLTPPAPAGEVRRVAGEVLRTAEPLSVTLTSHGPAARRRRHTRAVLGGLAVLALVGGPGWWWHWYPWIIAASAIPLVIAPILAEQRYRCLGHAVVPGYLVARAGLFPRTTNVLAWSGIIGWNLQTSFFQRRVGLCTLVATTAAGDGSVKILDVPARDAYALIGVLSPRLSTPFAARPSS